MDKILLWKFEPKKMHVTKKLNKYVTMSFTTLQKAREYQKRREENIKEGARVKYYEDKNRIYVTSPGHVQMTGVCEEQDFSDQLIVSTKF